MLSFNSVGTVGDSVGTVTKAGAEQSESRMPVGAIHFVPKCPYWLWCLHGLRFSGCRGSLPGVKRPEDKANHELPPEEGLGESPSAFMCCRGSTLITM